MRRVGLFQISVHPLMSGSVEASWLFLAAQPVGRSPLWCPWGVASGRSGVLCCNERVARLRNHTVRRAARRPPTRKEVSPV